MDELRRSGSDRRKDKSDIKSNQRSGEDRRFSLSENYLQFIKILEKIPIFQGLTFGQFQKILRICSKRFFKRDSNLCSTGDDSKEMFILLKGELKVTFHDGKELS